jgi:multiple sugar transport system permease protein
VPPVEHGTLCIECKLCTPGKTEARTRGPETRALTPRPGAAVNSSALARASPASRALTGIRPAAGYVLAKYEFRGKRALFNFVLAGVLVPGTALALPMYQLFASVSLVNTYWAVLIPGVVSPFGVYLSRIYAEAAVSDSVLEAARIDGSGEIRIFFRVVLRTLTPVLVRVFLFQFVGIWNNYFLPLVMLSNNALYPVTLGLTTWQAGSARVPQLLQTTIGGAFVSVIPLAIAMIVLQRFWQGGLTEGAVKQ